MAKHAVEKATPLQVIAFTNAKGGVGKTTSAGNVGLELASRGHRVLLVDLDTQADLSKTFGVETTQHTVGHALLEQAPVTSCIRQVRWLNDEDEYEPVPNLHLLPSCMQLGIQEADINDKPDYQFLLHKLLVSLAGNYDYAVLDCPPALGTLTYLAFCAADVYVIPCAPEQLSYNKIEVVRTLAEKIRERENPRLKLAGIVFTKHNNKVKRKLNEAILLAANAQHGRENILPSIRQDTLLGEAQAQQIPINAYSPGSKGAEDYAKLTTAILKRI